MKTIKKYSALVIILMSVSQFSACSETEEDPVTDSLPEATTGQAMFWTASDLGVGNITVFCNGTNQTINSYYSGVTPNCGATGAANFTLEQGTYSFNATGGTLTWSGNITVNSSSCSKLQLTANATGGNSNLNGKWTGSDGRIITISGSNGVFNSFGTDTWKLAFDGGFVKVGDLYIKNITYVNSTEWNAQPLWLTGVNGVVKEVKWGLDGTIIMNANGNSFTLTGTDPFNVLIIKSATFVRI